MSLTDWGHTLATGSNALPPPLVTSLLLHPRPSSWVNRYLRVDGLAEGLVTAHHLCMGFPVGGH